MNIKYDLGQLVRRNDAYYEILNIRFGMNDGKVEYQLCGVGWCSENELGEVMKPQ